MMMREGFMSFCASCSTFSSLPLPHQNVWIIGQAQSAGWWLRFVYRTKRQGRRAHVCTQRYGELVIGLNYLVLGLGC
jgi:hypothetical protein